MKINYDIKLKNFDFWSGAKDTIKYLNDDDFLEIEYYLSDLCDINGIDETFINDFFWFENDIIAVILGYKDFEDLMEDRE